MKRRYFIIDEYSNWDEFSYNIQDVFTDFDEALEAYKEMITNYDHESGWSLELYQWDKVGYPVWWFAHIQIKKDQGVIIIRVEGYERPGGIMMEAALEGGETPEIALERAKLGLALYHDLSQYTIEETIRPYEKG